MTPTQINLDALLRRAPAAAALTKAGFPIAKATLATKVCRGGGPRFRKFGQTVLYRWGDLLEWAEARTSPTRCSTAEADAQAAEAGSRHGKHKVTEQEKPKPRAEARLRGVVSHD